MSQTNERRDRSEVRQYQSVTDIDRAFFPDVFEREMFGRKDPGRVGEWLGREASSTVFETLENKSRR